MKSQLPLLLFGYQKIFNLRCGFYSLIIVFNVSILSYGQVATGNFGFEDGTFNGGWTGSIQDRDTRPGANPLPAQPGPLQAGLLQHCIMRQGTNDPLIPIIPTTPTGMQYAARIGNTVEGGHIATLSRSFQVTRDNMIFSYSYAVVLEDPLDNSGNREDGHEQTDAPHFMIRMYDQNNNEIPCAAYTVIVASRLPDFTHQCVDGPGNQSINNIGCAPQTINTAIRSQAASATQISCGGNFKDLYYKNWTTVSIALNDYEGQVVRIVFTAADCRPNGHMGYAYVSTAARALDVTKPGTICSGKETKPIVAPSFFKSYSWTGPGIVGPTNTQSITINQAGTYVVTLVAESDQNCEVEITYVARDSCPTFAMRDTLCETVKGSGQASNIDLSRFISKVTNSGSLGSFVSWHSSKTSPSLTNTLSYTINNNATIYAVVRAAGATRNDTVPLSFTINSRPNATIATINPICAGAQPFNVVATPAGGVFSGTGGVTPTGSFNPNTAGNFNVSYIVTDVNGCMDTARAPISVEAPPSVAAGPDQLLCGGDAPIRLAGSFTQATGAVWTAGNGSFNPNANDPVANYTPTPTEISAGSVTLTLTTTGNTVCPAASDQVRLSFSQVSSANAGPDQLLCENAIPITLQGAAGSATSVRWSSSSALPGVFSNSASVSGTYAPTAAEISQGSVTLRLTSFAPVPCNEAFDEVIIRFEKIPTANAGADQAICYTGTEIGLRGTATNAAITSWTGGSGTFAPSRTSLITGYRPTESELTNGSVTFTLATSGQVVCPAASDQMTVRLARPATANAGPDQLLCENVLQVMLQGSATNASSTNWTGAAFRPTSSNLTPNFTPTNADRARGSIELTLTVNAFAPCLHVSDKVLISFEKVPTVNAGPDQLLCVGEPISLTGTSTNATGITWSGEGSFTPTSTTLRPSYKATQQENTSGVARIHITSTGNVKCEADRDTMIVTLRQPPVGFLLPKYIFCEDDTVGVHLRPGTATTYLWSPGGATTPTFLATSSGKYSVTMSSARNCSTQVFTDVENICIPELYVADAFSPNADSKNEVYHIYGRHIGKFQMYIFNRWGEVIYESNDKHESWDGTYMGKPMQMGVYPWIITWEGDSEKYRGPYKKEGSVSVVR